MAALLNQPGLAADAAPALPATHLKVVGSWGFLSQYKNFEQPFWTSKVSETSGGQITAEITPFNQMGLKGDEIIRLMRMGLIDFGSAVLAYGATDDTEVEGLDLAGLSPTAADARKVVDSYLPVLDAYFQRKHGVKVLSVWPYPAQVIYCKSKLDRIADLKGRKVRVGTRPIAEFVEALGGVAIDIPFGEAYAQIKRGNIDCAITGTLPGNTARLPEVTHYLYPLPVGWSMAMHGVNLKVWSGLDPAVQAFLEQGMARLRDDIWAASVRETDEGIRCNTGSGDCSTGHRDDMVLLPVTDEDRRQLRIVLRDVVLRRWAQRCSVACVADWNRTVGKLTGLVARK
ncbi:TRAP transporter substrate-binding protein [Chitinimonas sp.]|uniref:TRAP transporter substrate-binding protein n=1 Tax=Chitinimonas sp. TaxID=1934313 RepID=UPI0035AE4FC9